MVMRTEVHRHARAFGTAMLCAALLPACLPCGSAHAAAKVAVDDPSVSKQHYLDSVQAREAWSYVPAGVPVTIAVIDTGVDAAHPDLKSNVVGGYDAANSAPGGQARARTDIDGHGTHVAGIAAATTANKLGIAGASFGANILPINIDNRDDSSAAITSDSIRRAYEHLLSKADADIDGDGRVQTVAHEYNVRVANLSIGSEWNDDAGSENFVHDNACLSAIKQAENAGILTICSAGNAIPGTTLPYRAWPADDPCCLGVAALSASGEIAPGSNYGSSFVCAPGTSMLTTSKSGGYENATGTSCAAALVSGVASILFAANPFLTPAQARKTLCSSADDLGEAGQDDVFGYGKVNALSAVKKVARSVRKGHRVLRSNVIYKVIARSSSKREVAAIGTANRAASALAIPNSIAINGKSYSVTSITKGAFLNCKKLKKLTLGGKVTKIGAGAFRGCAKLKTLTIQSKRLKKSAVKGCLKGSRVKTVKVPKASKKAYRKIFTKGIVGRVVHVK